MRPFFGDRRWLNYLSDDDRGDAIRAAYGPNYDRLVQIKRRVRPGQRLPPEPEHRARRIGSRRRGRRRNSSLDTPAGRDPACGRERAPAAPRAAPRDAPRRSSLRRRRDARRVRRRPARLNDAGLHANTTLLGEAILDADGRGRGHRRVRADPRSARRREAAGERRPQAHAPRPVLRRGDRVRERRAPGRARRRARHVHPHRHGAVGVRRRDACDLTSDCATPATTPSEPCCSRTSTGRPTTSSDCCRGRRTSASSRAPTSSRRDRIPGEGGRRPRVRRARRARSARRRVHRRRDARRSDHRQVQAFAAREGIARDRFEFQMLYGVRPALQRSIAAEGYKVLVATPFGPDWYPYLMRRLAERPANLGFFLQEPRPAMSSLPSDADVVVVGGGVIGTSIAFHLAEAGATSACSSAISSRADRRAAPPGAFARSSRIRSTSRSGCAASRRSRGSPSGPAPRSTSTRSGTSSSSTAPTTSRRSKQSVALQNELGVPSRFVDARARSRELCPIAGPRRRAGGDLLPARRPREPRGRRPGVRGRCASPRRDSAHRLRSDGNRRRRRGDPRRRDVPRRDRDLHRHLRGRRLVTRAREFVGVELPVEPYFREVGFTGPTDGLPASSPAHRRLLDGLLLPPRGAGAPLRDGRPRPTARLRRADRSSRGSRGHGGRRAPTARHSSTWASRAAGRATTR